jgi:hypothetical protein
LSADNFDGRILDVSKSGLRLLMATNVMPGSFVKVRMKDYIAFGVARYCAPATEGFFIGVQLDDHVLRKSIRAGVQDQPWQTLIGGVARCHFDWMPTTRQSGSPGSQR